MRDDEYEDALRGLVRPVQHAPVSDSMAEEADKLAAEPFDIVMTPGIAFELPEASGTSFRASYRASGRSVAA